MGSLSSNAVSAKARSMYAKKLDKNDYDELLKRRNISDLVSYLKTETEYGNHAIRGPQWESGQRRQKGGLGNPVVPF